MSVIQVDSEITLRLLEDSDSAELFSLIEKNRQHLRAFLGWLDITRSESDSKGFIKSQIEQNSRGQGFGAGIFYRSRLVGMAGYHPIDLKNRNVALGYWIAKDFEGNGIVRRCVKALTSHAFSHLDLERVEIRCADQNTRSQKIPVILGFSFEGTLRNCENLYGQMVSHRIYSMIKSEEPRVKVSS